MTAKIVTVICAMAIVAASLTALAWERAKPTAGELQARDVSAAAQAAVDVAAARARAAELPGRELAVTVGLWALAATGALVALGSGLAWVRYALHRSAWAAVPLAHPQALVGPAGVVVLSGRQADLTPQAIVAPPAAPMIAAPVDVIPERCDMASWTPGSEPALPVGLAAGGRLIEIPLGGRALITVAGLPGSGKSNLMRTWYAALMRQDARVVILDGKGGSDYAQGALVEDDDIDRALRDCLAEIDARLGRLRQAGALDWQRAGMTPSVLLVDELAVILDGDSGAWRLKALRRVARLGRAPGCVVIGASQMTQAAQIPTELRNLADVSLAFRLSRPEDARAAGVPGAHRLPAVPGRVAVAGLAQDVIECQSFLCNRATGAQLVYQPVQPGVVAPGNRLQPVATTLQPALSAQPVAQPALYRRNVALTPEQAAAIRAAHEAGASMNELCRRFYGSKDGAALAAIRAALEG